MTKNQNIENAYYTGLMSACGYRKKDLQKPLIGVINSWNDVNPGHKPFKELVNYVKEGIWSSGGAPAEFTVPAPCDGEAQMLGMNYILPSRDLIAASIESMVKAQGFDGLVPDEVGYSVNPKNVADVADKIGLALRNRKQLLLNVQNVDFEQFGWSKRSRQWLETIR